MMFDWQTTRDRGLACSRLIMYFNTTCFSKHTNMDDPCNSYLVP